MSEHYDVVIVGGGILGCASAFSLARRHVGRILLIERTTLGAQTTSRAAALITLSPSSPMPRPFHNLKLSTYCLAFVMMKLKKKYHF